MPELITLTAAGLTCEAGGFHVDPVAPVPRALLTHGHADHAHPGSGAYLCATPGLPVVRQRLPEAKVEGLPYGERRRIGQVTVSFHPAGHVLGSAQIRLESAAGEVTVVSGDYKRAPDPTCAPFEPQRCDTFVTEATFGLPVYRWEAPDRVIAEVLRWWEENRALGRASLLFCYVLGKAQRLLAELARVTDRRVFLHGAMSAMTDVYRVSGIAMLPTERVADTARGREFAGELILAPITARGTVWMRRFGDSGAAMASGWMRVRGERRRRHLERGFALSDHADWPALLDTVKDTGATRIQVTHGYSVPFAHHLRDLGLRAEALEMPSQERED